MKPYYYLFFALLFIVSQLACNKDDDNNGVSRKLDFTTSTKAPGYQTYTYNTAGQLIEYERSESKFSIVDNGSELHFTMYNKDESRVAIDGVYTLNPDGNIISGVVANAFSLNNPYTSNFTFEYDNNGYMIKRTEVRSNGNTVTSDLVWTNGDLTSIVWKQNGNPLVTDVLEYDNGTPDKNGISDYLFDMPMNDFVGKVSKHLQKGSYSLVSPSTTPLYVYTYQYDLNSDGYPSVLKLDTSDSNYHEVITYHYQ